MEKLVLTKDNSFLDGVIGTISVIDKKRTRYKRLVCKEWFNNIEYVTINDDGECLVIRKCYMEIPKSAKKIDRGFYVEIESDIPLGTFDLDEESNEDELVVYYR